MLRGVSALGGLNVLFFKPVVTPSLSLSTVTPADGAATADGVATELVTLTVFASDGSRKLRGGDKVVFSKVAGEAVLTATVDVGDGTYTTTVANGTAQTTVVQAHINNSIVVDTASVVFS